MSGTPISLIDLLSNTLIFNLIIPHIPIKSLLALSTASRAYHDLLKASPDTFRYLDLTTLSITEIDQTPIDYGGVSWRRQRMDEALTEEEFFSGPIRGLFYDLEQQNILKNVSTLIMDGLDVTVDVFSDIVLDTTGQFNVRVLSVRQVQRFLIGSTHKVSQIIRDAVRPGRPAGTPHLKALYLFGFPRDDSYRGSLDAWYKPTSPVYLDSKNTFWVKTLEAASGIILFDAVICRGPQHDPEWPKEYGSSGRKLANYALGRGCMNCKTSPEGPGIYGQSPPEMLPILSPPPITPCSISAMQKPPRQRDGTYPPMYARCRDCIRERQCFKCRRWICENCADDTDIKRWIARYGDIVSGAVPDIYLRGYNYNRSLERGRHDATDDACLCLDHCMPEEFAEGSLS